MIEVLGEGLYSAPPVPRGVREMSCCSPRASHAGGAESDIIVRGFAFADLGRGGD